MRIALLLLLACGAATASQPEKAATWTLDNGLVRRQISFDDKAGLVTTSWKNLADDKEFIDPSLEQFNDFCHEFRFQANERSYTGTTLSFRYVHASQHAMLSGDQTLNLLLSAKDGKIEVTLHYIIPARSTAVRQFLTIRNTSTAPITLTHVSIACVQLEPAKPMDLVAYGGYGEEPRELFFTGRVNDVAILMENAVTGDGFASLSEVPGYLKRTEVGVLGRFHQWQPGLQVMYDTDLIPFERSVTPGGSFDTAATSILLYRRGTSQDPHWLIPQYVLRSIARPVSAEAPLWMYNSWEPWQGKIESKQMLGVEKAAADAGIGLFVMDDGWEKKRGENDTDPGRFPDGLNPELELAHKRGLEFGLWFPLALISEDARVYKDHPDWACHDKNGQAKLSQGSGVVMDLTSPYQGEVIERLSEAIRLYHLRYIKLDFTTVFNTYGEEPGCYEMVQGKKSNRESIARTYEALQDIADQLHSRFPHLLIDYTFELWGEKHLIDYGLLRAADLDWLSNVEDHGPTDAGPKATRSLLYQRAMAIPAETMLIGNMQAETGSWQEHAATEMGSYPVFLGDLLKLSPNDAAHYDDWISRFRVLRSRVPLNESFFPLGSWRQPRSNAWDGFARFAHTGEGIIVLFRNSSNKARATIQIPGFPGGDFIVSSWITGRKFRLKGSELDAGYTATLESGTVTIFELHRP
ncbi:MAG TPA: alpha-galactosidase [Acidobacteriaceae bacterium]